MPRMPLVTWLIQTVDSSSGGWFTSIAIDSSDKVHISYSEVYHVSGFFYCTLLF